MWHLSETKGASAFISLTGGHMQDLGTLGGTNSVAYGINSRGQVVGDSTLISGFHQPHYAFLYSGGRMQDLNNLLVSNPGWILTTARGINDASQIAGGGAINGQTHAFLLTPVF
jgi:probable HAF family extracellular repeat protein